MLYYYINYQNVTLLVKCHHIISFSTCTHKKNIWLIKLSIQKNQLSPPLVCKAKRMQTLSRKYFQFYVVALVHWSDLSVFVFVWMCVFECVCKLFSIVHVSMCSYRILFVEWHTAKVTFDSQINRLFDFKRKCKNFLMEMFLGTSI